MSGFFCGDQGQAQEIRPLLLTKKTGKQPSGESESKTWIPVFTFATIGSTDVTYGETNSKSILEKQQMTLRISSVLSAFPRDKNVTIRKRHEHKMTNENEVRPQRSDTSQTRSILPLVGH